MNENDSIQSYITELRRGSLILIVLGALRKPYYGYSLLQTLQEQGIDIEANTLYPLLRRLESQTLLVSEWDTAESRPRKYYSISERGKSVYEELIREWKKMQTGLETIIGGTAQ